MGARDDVGGDAPALGASLRAFNRFELKYLVDRETIDRLRPELEQRLDRDPLAPDGGYPVWSLYHDNADLRCYWEKIEGIRFRRKVRIRHYGAPGGLTPDGAVWLEVKQRVNRVTQKRRARLAYADALAACAGRLPGVVEPRDRPLVDEVVSMAADLALRPTVVTGYAREPFVGRDEDSGLRVTIDRRVRGRDRDLDLAVEAESRLILRPDLAILEVKVNDRVPTWVVDAVARHRLEVVRVSKYCQAVEAFGRAPRSIFHAPDPVLQEA